MARRRRRALLGACATSVLPPGPGQVGLDVWLRDGNVFTCWSSMWDVIWHGELGSSLALLNAGFGLDCFMMRYQGVDWADRANWRCNKQ